MRSDSTILFFLHEEGTDRHLKITSSRMSCPGSVARMLSFSVWNRILLQYWGLTYSEKNNIFELESVGLEAKSIEYIFISFLTSQPSRSSQ